MGISMAGIIKPWSSNARSSVGRAPNHPRPKSTIATWASRRHLGDRPGGAGPLQQIGHFVLHFRDNVRPDVHQLRRRHSLVLLAREPRKVFRPFSDLPYLSLLVITVSMTVPMTTPMRSRGVP